MQLLSPYIRFSSFRIQMITELHPRTTCPAAAHPGTVFKFSFRVKRRETIFLVTSICHPLQTNPIIIGNILIRLFTVNPLPRQAV